MKGYWGVSVSLRKGVCVSLSAHSYTTLHALNPMNPLMLYVGVSFNAPSLFPLFSLLPFLMILDTINFHNSSSVFLLIIL
jgi:hypothetical protein